MAGAIGLQMQHAPVVSRGGWPVLRAAVRDLVGLAVIVLCLIVGSAVARWSHSTISGNVLGLVALLVMLWLRIVPITLVQRAADALLSVLPILFVPLYVRPFSDGAFWMQYGPTLLPVIVSGCAMIMIFARAIAGALMKR
jgi:holin-like protein